MHRAAELLVRTRPNAVVLEKSSYDEADINAQRISALRTFAEQLRAEIPLPVDADTAQTQEALEKKRRAGPTEVFNSPGRAVGSTAATTAPRSASVAAGAAVGDSCNPFFKTMNAARCRSRQN